MRKFYVPIILGSVRNGRQSAKVAEFVKTKMNETGRFEAEVLDLREADLPMMEERLRLLEIPPASLTVFGEKVARSEAIVIVSPEYNHGYPGVLKNAIDYLYAEYRRKPVGIVTVSSGRMGGVRVLEQLRDVMFAVGALPIPASLPISGVGEAISDDGTAADTAYEKRASRFVDELLWYTEAVTDRKARDMEAASS